MRTVPVEEKFKSLSQGLGCIFPESLASIYVNLAPKVLLLHKFSKPEHTW